MIINSITSNELKKLMDRGEVLLLDVREPAEYRAECINGSCLIPLGELSVEKLPSKLGPIVIHCRSGKRSEEACRRLLAQDPSVDVRSLHGAIIAWKEEGSEVKNLGCKLLPLDRQTQVVAGGLVLTGVILGVLVNRWFYLLSGFVGLGLIFAGLSGWCGMAKLLAKLPWNK